MKNNLKNKLVVMIACAFVISFAGTHACWAQEAAAVEKVAAANPELSGIDFGDDVLDLEALTAEKPSDAPMKDTGKAIVLEDAADEKGLLQEAEQPKAKTIAAKPEIDNDIDFLNETMPDNVDLGLATQEKAPKAEPKAASKAAPTLAQVKAPTPVVAPTNPLLDVQPFPDDDSINSLEIDANRAQMDSNSEVDAVIPEIGSGKSPFENFGNAILSRVDSDLFNQMSNIEKQTTLLRLELRREELKNRVEALRMARIKAQQEEDLRVQAEAERLKDLEADRQAKIVAEEEKLKQREIELEKLRQAKVINDYMNEMLAMNQQWVSKNAELQNKIHELEKERNEMLNQFRDKMAKVQENFNSLKGKTQSAIDAYKEKMEALNNHINRLKSSVKESEDKIRQMSNPSADGRPDKDAIDMSAEYAIMDITGKGDDIVAKIVSQDGTTFIVHKGSMLKNGEVVTSITDHYISFENNGVQSYLYTGGTVMEYEPSVSFNGSDRTPGKTHKESIRGDDSNVLGNAGRHAKKQQEVVTKHPRKSSGSLAFGSGTFVK